MRLATSKFVDPRLFILLTTSNFSSLFFSSLFVHVIYQQTNSNTYGCYSKNGKAYWGKGGSYKEKTESLSGNKDRSEFPLYEPAYYVSCFLSNDMYV